MCEWEKIYLGERIQRYEYVLKKIRELKDINNAKDLAYAKIDIVGELRKCELNDLLIYMIKNKNYEGAEMLAMEYLNMMRWEEWEKQKK